MIKNIIHYGAAATKARAMYGKLLSEAQWESLLAAGDLRAVWDVLRKCPAWERVGQVPVTAAAMSAALLEQLHDDCRRLGCFLDEEDRARLKGFLRYQEAERNMSPEDYQRWWSEATHKGDGLRRIVGAEADALNLVYILRLRRFPKSVQRAREYLIPIRYELRDDLIDRLLRASSDEAVLQILDKTRWGGVFRSLAPGDLEKQYQKYMEEFCRHILNAADAGIGVVQALLPIKDMERRKLLRLISAVAHGMDPRSVV